MGLGFWFFVGWLLFCLFVLQELIGFNLVSEWPSQSLPHERRI